MENGECVFKWHGKLSIDTRAAQCVIHTFDQKRLFGYAMNATLVPTEGDALFAVHLVRASLHSPMAAAYIGLFAYHSRYLRCILLR